MKKVTSLAKNDDPGTPRERDVNEGSKRSEFSRKKPLPSISIEKDPEFADSVLCAATMHISRKERKSSSQSSVKPACLGQGLCPRTRDIPKPGLGRRSPPIFRGPTHGPSGDLPPRKTVDGIHKRDSQADSQRYPLLNPPWRATCAIVEPTHAGSICFERLPRGLKQLKPVDLCYRHGHRKRLNHLEEIQNVDTIQKRGRTRQHKFNGMKKEGNFNTKKVNTCIGKSVTNTIAEGENYVTDYDNVTFVQGSFEEDNLDTSLTSTTHCIATKKQLETSPKPEQSIIAVDHSMHENVPVQANRTLREDRLQPGRESYSSEDIKTESARLALNTGECDPVTHEQQGEEITSNEACASDADVETSAMELCRTIPSEQTLMKANSLTFRHTVGRLYTDNRPNSFIALTAKEKELEHWSETTLTLQCLAKMAIREKDQANQNDTASTEHENTKSVYDDTLDNQEKTEFENNSKVLDSPEQEYIPCLHDQSSRSTNDVDATFKLEISKNSTEAETKEIKSESTSLKASFCEDNINVLLNDQMQVNLQMKLQPHVATHSGDNLDESPKTALASKVRQLEPNPILISNEATREESLQMTCDNEVLSFSVDLLTGTNDMGQDMSNPSTQTTCDHNIGQTQEPLTGNFLNQDDRKTELEAVSVDQMRLGTENDEALRFSQHEIREAEKFDKSSQSPGTEPPQDPQLSSSYQDLATDDLATDNDAKSLESSSDKDDRIQHHESSSLKNDRSFQGISDGSSKIERCTIRKIPSHDSSGKCKYIVLPDEDRIKSESQMETVRPSRANEDDDTQEDSSAANRRSLKISSKCSTDSKSTRGEMFSIISRNKSSDPRSDPNVVKCRAIERSSVSKIEAITEVENIEPEEDAGADNRGKTDKDNELKLSRKDRTGIGRRARTKLKSKMSPIQEDGATDYGIKDNPNGKREEILSPREDRDEEVENKEDEWFPPFAFPLQGQPRTCRRINFSDSNRFMRIHGNNLQSDGPWGQGDRIERPRNYVEPNVSLDDMCLRFFTDITPLDLAFNAINVVNSCSNSIGYHSCNNQKRMLAALEGLKHDDVYKHALVCPLARQCAAATREFSQSLHKVFRRFSNRTRAAQEALLEYYRALAAGEVNSPEMLQQIQRDGKSLYMVWEGGQYVTRYAEDTLAELSNSSSDTSCHPSVSNSADHHDTSEKS
ncbi:uncharacterized protein LOC110989520 [Acanthaster planci]|uniref:Uncharacterized protein LOC110989520 n=1 Tax=Acanthaster planci TaxID=133434 RepID=A0A8B7ZY27_ACAPL|nr:uncharacterized protein LOC110989520 [Acanthaster planci]